jgi:type I restriction enzyme S subunit
MTDGWKEYELGELLSYEQPTPYIVESTNYDERYETPVLTAGKSFILGYTNEENGIFEALPVIIFDDFTTASQYVNFRFKVKSSAMKILTASTALVLPKFIYYRMQIIEFDHSTHKRYWIQQYSKIKVEAPSLPEQERIVTRIEELFSELDNGVKTLQTIKQQLAVYRQAVLKEAFKNITIRRPIREMSSIVTSGSRGWAQYYSDEGARFIRIGNLTRDTIDIDLGDIQYVKLPDNAEGIRSRLQPNDVLISITADLGSIGLVPKTIGEAYINQHIAMIRFYNAKQGNFMAWYLRSEYGQKDLLKNKRGAGKLGLGLDDIRDSKVPVVSDEIAQKIVDEIESRLSVCDSIDKTVDTALQQAEALRQSILKEAFEGRLI